MPDSKISVVIPTYNNSDSIGRSIKSVLNQSTNAHEIIVVNDGSTDGTAEILKKFKNKIIYLEQTNQGQGAARNTGLKAATGAYIAFLDADDYWKPAFLETCLEFLEAHPECVAVNTGLITRMHDGREVIQPESLHRPGSPTAPFVIDDFYVFWARHDHVRTGSVMIRKSVIERAGGQRADLRVSQDLEYWGYIATFGPWGYIPEPLWVGNSRAAARALGWLPKYRQRRRLCPTVESWQKRILPRLKSDQMKYFKAVRGRVAAGYAQNHILGGNSREASHIVKTYGKEMPSNRMTRLIKLGHQTGAFGWWLVCRIVVAREYVKAKTIDFV